MSDSFRSKKIHFRIKNGNRTHHKLYKENISCRQKVRFRSKINSLVFSLIALWLKIAGTCIKMCKSLWFFEIFLKFSDSLGFLGFKRWNYTVRWVVNGTILKVLMQWRHSLVLSWCLALPSLGGRWWRISLSVGDGAFWRSRGRILTRRLSFQRRQNSEWWGCISRSLTLKPSIYIHDLSQIIFMYTVYLCTLSPRYKTDHRIRRSCRISVASPLVLSDSNHRELKIFNLAISAGFKWFYCSLVPSSSQVLSIRSLVKVHGVRATGRPSSIEDPQISRWRFKGG